LKQSERTHSLIEYHQVVKMTNVARQKIQISFWRNFCQRLPFHPAGWQLYDVLVHCLQNFIRVK
jgi:hypothetical protein